MTIVGPRTDAAQPAFRDTETPMGPTARLVRSVTPRALIDASRPLRAHIRRSTPAAALWTARKRLKWTLRAPSTFNEKIEYKLAWDRGPTLRLFADKVAVRDHVARTIGPQYLAEQYSVVEDPRDLDLAALPTRYVVKPSHASGAVIVVHEAADPALRLPTLPEDRGWVGATAWVRSEHLERDRFDAMCDLWLRHDYWRALGSTEWAYHDIPRRIIVEEFLEGEGDAARDVKLIVMHGRVTWIRLNTKTEGLETTTNFDRDGAVLPFEYTNATTDPPARLPDTIDEMIRIAETLGSGVDLVRVDLYDADDRIVFGELTNYPSAGRASFDPPEYDRIMGAPWRPPRRYRRRPA